MTGPPTAPTPSWLPPTFPASTPQTSRCPAGSYEYKVAVNDSWDEAYGLNGGGDNIPLTIAGETGIRFTFDDTTHRVGLAPLELDGAYSDADADLVADPVRQPGADNVFYFVMTDRFENGDASNDTGGLTGDSLATGYDPTAKGFYNGGDIAGLRSRLDYIDQLGTTAIWLTPSFKNKPVQGTGANASAGYHGYWITDFTQIDPHLGTNAELEALIDEAHAQGHQGLLRHHHQPHGRRDRLRGRPDLVHRPGDEPVQGRRRRRLQPGRLRRNRATSRRSTRPRASRTCPPSTRPRPT